MKITSAVQITSSKMVFGLDFYVFCLYFCLYFAAGSGGIPICSSKQEVTAIEGGAALLSCQFTYGKSSDDLTVVWKKTREGDEAIVIHNQRGRGTFKNQSVTYVNPTAMSKNRIQSTNTTLGMQGIRAEDAGKYSCWIIRTPPTLLTSYKCCTIHLYVTPKWKGDIKVTVVTCSLYLLFLSFCIFVLCKCRTAITPVKQ